METAGSIARVIGNVIGFAIFPLLLAAIVYGARRWRGRTGLQVPAVWFGVSLVVLLFVDLVVPPQTG